MKKEDLLRQKEILCMIADAAKGMKNDLRGHKIVLFGSRAQKTHHERSDYDIGILGDRPVSYPVFMKLEEKLLNLPTLFTIELVDFQRTDESFRTEALKKTIPLLTL